MHGRKQVSGSVHSCPEMGSRLGALDYPGVPVPLLPRSFYFWRKNMPKPNQIEYFNGESGEPIVRLTMDQALSCSHQGDCEEDCKATIEQVQWLTDDAGLRRLLYGTGAWTDLNKVSSERLKIRALWIAAGDIRENPKDYGHEP